MYIHKERVHFRQVLLTFQTLVHVLCIESWPIFNSLYEHLGTLNLPVISKMKLKKNGWKLCFLFKEFKPRFKF